MPGSDGSGSSCDVRIYLRLDPSPTPTAASDPPGPGFLKLMTEFTSTSTLRCFSASWWSDHVKTLTDGRAFNTASSSSTDQLSLVLANNNTSSFVSYFLIINLTLSNKCSSVKDTGFPSEMCQDVFLTVLDHMMPLFNNINQNMTKNQTISHQKPVLLWVLEQLMYLKSHDQYSANHMNADHGFNFQLILS